MNKIKSGLFAIVLSIAVIPSVYANLISVDSSSPAVNELDIASSTSDGSFALVWSDRPAIGQTFTMGLLDGWLDAITLQVVSGIGITDNEKTYTVRVGSVSGNAFTTKQTSVLTQSGSYLAGDFLTFVLSSPVFLTAESVFGFDIALNTTNKGWQAGIPQFYASTAYNDGQGYTSQARGMGTPTFNVANKDLLFHLDVREVSEPGVLALFALGFIGLAMRRFKK